MGKGKKCVTYTVGYRYSLGMHMAICHGPVDAVLGAKTDVYYPWSGEVTESESIYISRNGLYGGKDREGGVAGQIDIAFGDPDQGANDYLISQLGHPMPAFRGVLSMIFRQVYLGDSHYLKNWAWRVRHCLRHSSWGGAAATARIGNDMNPAHIIFACLTDGQWGMGYLFSDIDHVSFAAAAQTLYDEGFGLSLIWDQSTSIEDFIEEIKRHIEAALYVERTTGRWELHLIRDDYDAETLPVLDPSNVSKVESFTRRTAAELVNTLILKYRRHTDQDDIDESITVHNTAMVQRLGQTIHQSVNFPGISKPELAASVAWRELQKASTDLSSLSVTAVPTAEVEALREGQAFVITWPKYGITAEVMRVMTIDWGTMSDGKVRITAAQDVWGSAQALYGEVPVTGWTDPISAPLPVVHHRLDEMPYWEVLQRYGADDEMVELVGAEAGVLMGAFVKPVADAFNCRLYTAPSGGTLADRGKFDFTPTGVLSEPAGKTDTAFSVEGFIGIRTVLEGSLAIIGDEWVVIDTLNPVTGHINVVRGVLDTVPADHAAGARIWFVDEHYGTDGQDVQTGFAVKARACTITGKGETDLAEALESTLTFAHRAVRPYPPGRMRINTQAYPDHIVGALTVAWAHRDRLQQTVYIVNQDEGDIGPEEGVTYRLRIYGETDTLLRTYGELEITEQAYSLVQEVADSGALGRPNDQLRIVLDAQRDGYDAWQVHDHTIECRGYGMLYGAYYGE